MDSRRDSTRRRGNSSSQKNSKTSADNQSRQEHDNYSHRYDDDYDFQANQGYTDSFGYGDTGEYENYAGFDNTNERNRNYNSDFDNDYYDDHRWNDDDHFGNEYQQPGAYTSGLESQFGTEEFDQYHYPRPQSRRAGRASRQSSSDRHERFATDFGRGDWQSRESSAYQDRDRDYGTHSPQERYSKRSQQDRFMSDSDRRQDRQTFLNRPSEDNYQGRREEGSRMHNQRRGSDREYSGRSHFGNIRQDTDQYFSDHQGRFASGKQQQRERWGSQDSDQYNDRGGERRGNRRQRGTSESHYRDQNEFGRFTSSDSKSNRRGGFGSRIQQDRDQGQSQANPNRRGKNH